jgi:hypothetical protein
MKDEEIVICQVCSDGEVNSPGLDYCHVCGRALCDDCIAATNAEHGLRFCRDCVEAGKVEVLAEDED